MKITEHLFGKNFNDQVYRTLLVLNNDMGIKEYWSEDIALRWLRDSHPDIVKDFSIGDFGKIVTKVDLELLSLLKTHKTTVVRGHKVGKPVFAGLTFECYRHVKGFRLTMLKDDIAKLLVIKESSTQVKATPVKKTETVSTVETTTDNAPKLKKNSKFLDVDPAIFSKGLASKLIVTLDDLIRIHGNQFYTTSDVTLRIIERYVTQSIDLIDPDDFAKFTLLVSNALSAKFKAASKELVRTETHVAPVYAKIHFPRCKSGMAYKPSVETAVEAKPERTKAKVFAEALVDAGVSLDGGVTTPLSVVDRARTMLNGAADPLSLIDANVPDDNIAKDLPNRSIGESEVRINVLSNTKNNDLTTVKTKLKFLTVVELLDVLNEVHFHLRKQLD